MPTPALARRACPTLRNAVAAGKVVLSPSLTRACLLCAGKCLRQQCMTLGLKYS